MPADYSTAFASLRSILANHADKFSVTVDKPTEYTLVTQSPSPLPQHKNEPMFFGSVRLGKAYASFHLFPLYVNPGLANGLSPALKKRMQGKSCFNFKTPPEPDVSADLERLAAEAVQDWARRKWL
jgi:hypothetical protein